MLNNYMTDNIVIIDYGVGNILSIKNAIEYNGYKPIVSKNSNDIENASHIILPGVGSFPAAMKKLRDLSLIQPIKKAIDRGTNLLGICLGMQLLFSRSEEFEITKGLNLISGDIIKLNKISKKEYLKLPNIGWRSCEITKINQNTKILKTINNKDEFYFVHSYALSNFKESLILAYSKYNDVHIPALIKFKKIYGCQFHPEKSGPKGLQILKNFLEL